MLWAAFSSTYKCLLINSKNSCSDLPALNCSSINLLKRLISMAKSYDNGSISENQLGTVGGLLTEVETCAVIPRENLNKYTLPPKTKTSPGLRRSRKPSSIFPTICSPTL